MRSRGYIHKCPDCGVSLRDGRKQFCSPCGDKRRDTREAKYREARRQKKQVSDCSARSAPDCAPDPGTRSQR
jgi:hypothetical protein